MYVTLAPIMELVKCCRWLVNVYGALVYSLCTTVYISVSSSDHICPLHNKQRPKSGSAGWVQMARDIFDILNVC